MKFRRVTYMTQPLVEMIEKGGIYQYKLEESAFYELRTIRMLAKEKKSVIDCTMSYIKSFLFY